MPSFKPIDINALAETTLGLLIVLIPVLGLTLRFALKPLVEAYSRSRPPEPPADLERLTRRVLELEQHVHELEERLALTQGEVPRLRSLPPT